MTTMTSDTPTFKEATKRYRTEASDAFQTPSKTASSRKGEAWLLNAADRTTAGDRAGRRRCAAQRGAGRLVETIIGRTACTASMTAALVNELIEAADALPAHLRDWLVDGLQAWQDGTDLEAALHLVDSGASYMGLDERDQMLVFCINSAPGESDAAKMTFFIEAIQDKATHPDETAQRFIAVMKSAQVYIPGTVRHLRRIMQGRRQDGWREREADITRDLCPEPVQRFNGATIKQRTGT